MTAATDSPAKTAHTQSGQCLPRLVCFESGSLI
jgi:hypothetical protein